MLINWLIDSEHLTIIYERLYIWTADKDWSSQLWKPEKHLGLNGIRTHNLCDAGAVLYQLSYQANSSNIWYFIYSFTFFTLYGYIMNSQCDQLPVGLVAQLVSQRSWVGLPFMNCCKTNLNIACFISDFYPLAAIQTVMQEVTADPAVFHNCTLRWNRWNLMNWQQIHLQVLTSQIKGWSGTPRTVSETKYLWNKNGADINNFGFSILVGQVAALARST